MHARALALTSALSLAFAFAFTAHNAHAYCRTTTERPAVAGTCSETGIPLFWNRGCVGFSLAAEGSPELAFDLVQQTATDAAAKWRTESCTVNGTDAPSFSLLPLGVVTTPTGYSRTGSNANTVSFNRVWAPDAFHRDGTIAVTIVSYDKTNGEILDADIELNQVSDENPGGFQFTVGNEITGADLPTILTHEFGHLQGLAHSDEPDAVMWPEAGLGEQRRTPTRDDVNGICEAYPPVASPRRCNLAPLGGLALMPNGGEVTGSCSVSTRTLMHGTQTRAGIAIAVTVCALAMARRKRRHHAPHEGV